MSGQAWDFKVLNSVLDKATPGNENESRQFHPSQKGSLGLSPFEGNYKNEASAFNIGDLLPKDTIAGEDKRKGKPQHPKQQESKNKEVDLPSHPYPPSATFDVDSARKAIGGIQDAESETGKGGAQLLHFTSQNQPNPFMSATLYQSPKQPLLPSYTLKEPQQQNHQEQPKSPQPPSSDLFNSLNNPATGSFARMDIEQEDESENLPSQLLGQSKAFPGVPALSMFGQNNTVLKTEPLAIASALFSNQLPSQSIIQSAACQLPPHAEQPPQREKDAEEKHFELPKEDPNIERLRRILEEKASLLTESQNQAELDQDIQLRELKAKLDSLKRKKNHLVESKLRLERQTRLLREAFSQKGTAPTLNLRPLSEFPPALNEDKDLKGVKYAHIKQLLVSLEHLMKRRCHITRSISGLIRETEVGEEQLSKRTQSETKAIIDSQNIDLNRIRKEYQEQRRIHEQLEKKTKRRMINSSLSHSAVSSAVRTEGHPNIRMEADPKGPERAGESSVVWIALGVCLATIVGILLLHFAPK